MSIDYSATNSWDDDPLAYWCLVELLQSNGFSWRRAGVVAITICGVTRPRETAK